MASDISVEKLSSHVFDFKDFKCDLLKVFISSFYINFILTSHAIQYSLF